MGQAGHVVAVGMAGMARMAMVMPMMGPMVVLIVRIGGRRRAGAVEMGLAMLVVDMRVIVTHGGVSRGKRAFP